MKIHKVKNKKTGLMHRFMDATWQIKIKNKAALAYEYIGVETAAAPPNMNTIKRKTQNVSSRNVGTKPANTKPKSNKAAACIPCGG